MQQHVDRLRWAVLPVALRVGGVVALCIAALSFLAFHSTSHASATGLSRMMTGTVASSPSSGPVGTTISVSGSDWNEADGTSVSFGYEVNSNCSIVSDSQNGSLRGGSFSGWFRWPSGTPLNTYSVCAMIENAMAVAGNFSVLSSSPPTVAISPSTLTPATRATISASNYYPAGTPVNFAWVSGNTVIENLNSATSDTSGTAILTFTVPKLSIASGSYTIDASAGSGQPASLFSSTNFTYSAPIVSPSPTPQPSPRPSPTMTPTVTPTTTTRPTVTPTVRATVASASPTAGASPTVGNSQTPTNNGTSSGNSGDTNTGASTSGSLNNPLLIGGMVVLAGALLAGVAALLLMRRRRKAALAWATEMSDGPAQVPAPWVNPQGVAANSAALFTPSNNGLPAYGNLPGNPNPFSYPSYNAVSTPGMSAPSPGNMPAMPPTPAPVLVGAGVVAGNSTILEAAAHPDPGTVSAVPLTPQLPAWLTNPSARGSASPAMPIPADPSLDAMRLQAQSGLFVLPRPFKDERSQ